MLAIHVVVPPHPGIVGSAGILNADIGSTTVVGLLLCIPVGVLAGYFIAKRLNRRDYVMLHSAAEPFRLFGHRKIEDVSARTPPPAAALLSSPQPRPLPARPCIITLIVLPILMIMVGTVGAVLLPKGSTAADIATFVGLALDGPA